MRDLPQMKVKPRKLKVSGLPSPEPRDRPPHGDRPPDCDPGAGLVRVELERERRQPLAHRLKEAAGVGLMLETDDDVVGIAHEDHVAFGFTPSVALGPEVEPVVQVDVGEQRRDRRALPRPLLCGSNLSRFENPRLQPFSDQADDALVADAVLQQPDEPILAHRVEELRNIGVDDEVHLGAVDRRRQGVERVVRPSPRPKAVAEAKEILLVNRVQRCDRGALDDPRVKPEDKPCP